MRKMMMAGAALALAANGTSAIAQSNLASELPGRQEGRVNVGVVIPFGSAGSKAERAPRLEAWSERGRYEAASTLRIRTSPQEEVKPVRLGVTLDGQTRLMINGREMPRQENKQGVSTVGWVAIGVGVAVLAFGVVLIDHVNNTS